MCELCPSAGDGRSLRALTRRRFLRLLGAGLPVWALATRTTRAAAPDARPPIESARLAASLPLHTRAEWATQPCDPSRLIAASAYERITVHHAGNLPTYDTDSAATALLIRGVHDAHRKRDYGDVGYHFIVDYGGDVWEGRGLAYEGAHVIGENDRNLGIMLLGNFDQQTPSARQLDAVRLLVTVLRNHYAIAPRRVYGHRDLGQSACPGRFLYPHVAALRT